MCNFLHAQAVWGCPPCIAQLCWVPLQNLAIRNSPAWSRKGNSGLEWGIICKSQSSRTLNPGLQTPHTHTESPGPGGSVLTALTFDLLAKGKQIRDFNTARPESCHQGQGTHLLQPQHCSVTSALTLENAHQKHLHARLGSDLPSSFLHHPRAKCPWSGLAGYPAPVTTIWSKQIFTP